MALGPAPLSIDGRLFDGFPPYFLPVTDVRTLLLRPEYDPQIRDAVWAHVIDRARTGADDWMVACVGLALPALIVDFARLTHEFPGDGEDIQIAMLATFVDQVNTLDTTAPWIMQRLRLTARDAGRQALREILDAPIPREAEFESRPPRPPWGHVDLVLARAVGERVISVEEADLIIATRLDDTSLQDYAAQRGLTYDACRKARARAVRALRPYLLALIGESSGVWDDGLTDEVDRRVALGTRVGRVPATQHRSRSVVPRGWGRDKKPRPRVSEKHPPTRS